MSAHLQACALELDVCSEEEKDGKEHEARREKDEEGHEVEGLQTLC